MLEKHPFFSQTFIPKGNTPFLVVVSPPSEEPVIENIRAFISNGDQGISYSRGVWHFPLISIHDNSQFIVIDRKHNIDTDTIKQCIVKRFEDTNITVELSL
jgi:ureidoglycolate lyase